MRMTSREFNQDTARAKREAALGPVYVTDRGKPTHVLLTVADYERLAGPRKTLGEMLHDPATAPIDIDFPRDRSLPRPGEFDVGA